jgi:predicted enzyme related to lactoylglutathione lyase
LSQPFHHGCLAATLIGDRVIGNGGSVTLVNAVAVGVLAAVMGLAQESGIHVRAVRVLATDPEAIANFYEKAFGMSETRRAANSATFKEIIINFGATSDKAKAASTTPIVIATRPKEAPAGAMASLILEVPNLEKAIDSAKASGGVLLRGPSKSGEGLNFAFVKDPDGNQIELVNTPK